MLFGGGVGGLRRGRGLFIFHYLVFICYLINACRRHVTNCRIQISWSGLCTWNREVQYTINRSRHKTISSVFSASYCHCFLHQITKVKNMSHFIVIVHTTPTSTWIAVSYYMFFLTVSVYRNTNRIAMELCAHYNTIVSIIYIDSYICMTNHLHIIGWKQNWSS